LLEKTKAPNHKVLVASAFYWLSLIQNIAN
jgi:hypothetical protein